MEIKSEQQIKTLERDYLKIALYVIFVLSTIIAAVWMCAIQGGNILDIFLPNSYWNDEVIYYKQIEGMVHYGTPQGYFGYNEMLPKYMTFGAWSPVMLIPYFLFGKMFGWNLFSPIICNLSLVTLSYLAFVTLVKPDKKQTIGLIVFVQFFTLYNRYIISGMSEALSYAGIIVLAGLLYYLYKNPSSRKGVWVYIGLSAVLTLMRPYNIVFFIFVLYLLISQKRWWGIGACLVTMLATLAAYFWISNNLCAPYFSPLVDLTFLDILKSEGLFACGRFIFLKTITGFGEIFTHITSSARKSHGAVYAVLFVTIILLISLLIVRCKKKEYKPALFFGFVLVANFLVLFAIVLLYSTYVGSRHMILFLLLNSMLIILIAGPLVKATNIACVLMVFVLMANDPYVYQVPFATAEAKISEQNYTRFFEEKLSISSDSRWDNTVLFILSDTNEETGTIVSGQWQFLYYLPPGFGINFALPDIDISTVNSKYIYVIPGGKIDSELSESDAVEVIREMGFAIYQLY